MEENMNSFEQMTSIIDANISKRQNDEKRKLMLEEKTRKEEQFNEGILKLQDKVLEENLDSSSYAILGSFLDAGVNLQEMIKSISSITDAMTCLSDAIGWLDSIFDYDNQLIDESIQHNYGFFSRLKQQRKYKKAIRNNANRIKITLMNLNNKYNMTISMTKAFAKCGSKFNKKIAKKTKKIKKGSKNSGSVFSPKTEELLKKRKEELANNKNLTNTNVVDNSPSNSSGKGFDDIL